MQTVTMMVDPRAETQIADPGHKKYRQLEYLWARSADSYNDGGPDIRKVQTVTRIVNPGLKKCR